MSAISVLESLALSTRPNKTFSQYSIVREYLLLHKQLGSTFTFNKIYHEISSQYVYSNLTYSGVSAALSRMEKGGYLEFVAKRSGYKFIRRDANGRPRTNNTWEVPEVISTLQSVMQQWINSPDTNYPETTYRSNQCTLGTWLVCLTQIWKARRNREIKCSLPSSLASHNVVRAVSSNPRFGD